MPARANQLWLEFPDPVPVWVSEPALRRALRRPVRLVFTDNASTMLSARTQGRTLLVRAHRMFRWTDAETFAALVCFLKTREDPSGALDGFIARNRHQVRPSGRRTGPRGALSSQGRHHDLGAVLARLCHEYFPDLDPPLIGWGRRPRRRGRSLRMGSYDPELHLIRVHPRLDRALVPRYVIEALVHHELCHAQLARTLGPEAGLRHDRRFKDLASGYCDLSRALAWERENLHRI